MDHKLTAKNSEHYVLKIWTSTVDSKPVNMMASMTEIIGSLYTTQTYLCFSMRNDFGMYV